VSLNIKNEETHRLVRELAELTGESQTEAVTEAVRERLARVRNTTERRQERIEETLAMGREIASRMPPEWRTMDVDDYLYDENGLPK
jgi:antitoxin VapB